MRKLFLMVAKLFLVVAIAVVTATAQTTSTAQTTAAQTAGADATKPPPPIRLATTTSTEHSGLLAEILPAFTQASGYAVRVIAVGSGNAMRLGRDGEVDALLTHDPARENKFVSDGFGVARRQVMQNYFVVVGPPDDPAGVAAAVSLNDAMQRLARGEVKFISRGDESGTHRKELSLWKTAGIKTCGEWRLQSGQGMSSTLQIADQLRAYTLVDRGTWLFLRAKTSLQIVYQGDAALLNPYAVIAVNPARHAVNYSGAMALINWLVSPPGQAAIGAYKINAAQLFTPAAH